MRACASIRRGTSIKVMWDEEHDIPLSMLIHDLALPPTWPFRTVTFHMRKSVGTEEGLTQVHTRLSGIQNMQPDNFPFLSNNHPAESWLTISTISTINRQLVVSWLGIYVCCGGANYPTISLFSDICPFSSSVVSHFVFSICFISFFLVVHRARSPRVLLQYVQLIIHTMVQVYVPGTFAR